MKITNEIAELHTKIKKNRHEIVSIACGVNWTRMMIRMCCMMYADATPTGRMAVGIISAGYCIALENTDRLEIATYCGHESVCRSRIA